MTYLSAKDLHIAVLKLIWQRCHLALSRRILRRWLNLSLLLGLVHLRDHILGLACSLIHHINGLIIRALMLLISLIQVELRGVWHLIVSDHYLHSLILGRRLIIVGYWATRIPCTRHSVVHHRLHGLHLGRRPAWTTVVLRCHIIKVILSHIQIRFDWTGSRTFTHIS